MVTLTEVEDEHFQSTQAGPDVDDDDFTDTGTSLALPSYDGSLFLRFRCHTDRKFNRL